MVQFCSLSLQLKHLKLCHWREYKQIHLH